MAGAPGRIVGPTEPDLREALRAFRSAFAALATMSGINNVLMLTGAFFMLEIYDRVLPSRSVPTLVGLTILAVLLYAFSALLELIRSRLLSRAGLMADHALSARVFNAVMTLPLKSRGGGDGLQPIRDLDTIRAFLASGAPPAFFDLPWLPIYLAICFYFHFWIGAFATLGALTLVAMTLWSENLTREPSRLATQFSIARNSVAQAGRRNAEVLRAMGLGPRLEAQWNDANRRYLAAQQTASDIGGSLGVLSRTFRLLLQSALLGIGAYLAIEHEATAGIIIAGSIVGARARAGGYGDCPLAAFRAGASKLGTARRTLDSDPKVGDADAPSPSANHASSRKPQRRPARRYATHHSRCRLRPEGRAGAGRYRSDGVRRVDPRARSGRSLGAATRLRAAGLRNDRAMDAGTTRPAHRLFAARCGTLRWHGRAEHRSL
jgi:ABC-type multidrug transport system fused ATPase/permease subunit